jgi:hypothetical protein
MSDMSSHPPDVLRLATLLFPSLIVRVAKDKEEGVEKGREAVEEVVRMARRP